MTSATDSNGPIVAWTYDGLNRLTQWTQPQGTVSYVYDKMGRVVMQSAPHQGDVAFAYNATGNPNSITQSGGSILFTYDAMNRHNTVTYSNGVQASYAYDADSRPVNLNFTNGGTSLGNLTYTYDASGHIINTGGSLARVTLPPSIASLGYDAAGELTTNGNQTWVYDADGNLSAANGNTYTWDTRNQLIGINRTGFSAQFAYLPNGQRFSRTVNGNTTRYLYSGANYIQEQNALGAVNANILTSFGTDAVFTRTSSAGSKTLIRDVVGSTVAVANATGALDANCTYTPYGASVVTGNAAGNSQTFTGREDDGTGLLYLRNRYYDPVVGRFLQPDSLQLRAGFNFYSYVGGNPIGGADRFGKDEWAGGGISTKGFGGTGSITCWVSIQGFAPNVGVTVTAGIQSSNPWPSANPIISGGDGQPSSGQSFNGGNQVASVSTDASGTPNGWTINLPGTPDPISTLAPWLPTVGTSTSTVYSFGSSISSTASSVADSVWGAIGPVLNPIVNGVNGLAPY